MIITTYDPGALQEAATGVDLSAISLGSLEEAGVAGGWIRVSPGCAVPSHQHDEIETFVIVAGAGDLIVDATRRPVAAGTVIQFEPFETHSLVNTGQDDLLYATFYWRNPDRAARAARAAPVDRRRFGERPIFVFSSPPTPNGGLHLGHLSGPYLGADAFVRFQRMNGARAWHLSGTDDLQSYVEECAAREGRSPRETAAHHSADILATLEMMDIEIHQFSRPSADDGHAAGLRAFFSRLVTSGRVEPRDDAALFDGTTGRYLYEPYVSGGCPTCGAAAGGNMCEECGEPNACADLTQPRAKGSADTPCQGRVIRYSLPLHELRTDILDLQQLARAPGRMRELVDRILRRDRLDIPLTHPAEWGVPPAEADAPPGQVIWSIVDMGYAFLHDIQSLGRTLGEDWRTDAPRQDWKIVHFLGSDNLFYYSTFWPAMYKLAYPGWAPDIDYHVNEFYELNGGKFSTSRGNVIWGKDVLGPHSVDSVRFYLALTRPEGRRTNFTVAEYEAVVRERLTGGWQRWLNDLGSRVDRHFGGAAPDAGTWTPEHTAFLAGLGTRLAALTGALGQDGFSLNRAAEALDGIVADTVRFAARESAAAEAESWQSESRTAIALELAAARLLAHGAAPVMPRFAARLAAALDAPPPVEWPKTVALLPPGSRVDLAGQVFFGAITEPEDASATVEAAPAPPPLTWLGAQVRELLRLPGEEPVDGRTLVALGMESLQAIALQYQILRRTGADVTIEDLLGDRTVAELATFLGAGLAPEAVAAPAEVASP